MEMTFSESPVGAVVGVSGDVDLSNSPRLRATLQRLLRKKTRRVVIDLTEVSYVDSSGLATFIECLQGLRQYGGELRLAGVSSRVKDVFALAQLERVFQFYASVDEAIS